MKTNCGEKISEDNFFAFAEIITINAVRSIGYKYMPAVKNLYSKLVKDIFHGDEEGWVLSDGYDLLQEVSCVLYENMGKALKDVITFDNKAMTVYGACLRTINQTVYQNQKYNNHTRPIRFKKDGEPVYEQREETEDYTEYDKIIAALKPNETQMAVLNCLMANMRFTEIVKLLKVSVSTPWNCRIALQNKYRKIFH